MALFGLHAAGNVKSLAGTGLRGAAGEIGGGPILVNRPGFAAFLRDTPPLTVGTGLNAIARFDGKRFQPMLLPVSATAVQSGPDGTLYLSLSEPNAYQLAVMRDDNIVGVFTNAPGMSWTEVSCFDRSKDGSLWAGTTSKGIFRFPAATGTVQRYNLGLLTNQVNVIRCDLTGGTWVGVNGGIVRLDGTVRQEFRESEGAPGKHLFAIEAGAEGNVWFAAEDGGLSRFDGKSMQPIPPGSGSFVPGSVQRILRDASGSLWFATMTGVTRYDGTSWVPLDEGDGLLPGYINSLAQDVSGAMWFGCDAGVTRYQPAVFKNPSPSLTVQADRLCARREHHPRGDLDRWRRRGTTGRSGRGGGDGHRRVRGQ